jgi:hypothetical protein
MTAYPIFARNPAYLESTPDVPTNYCGRCGRQHAFTDARPASSPCCWYPLWPLAYPSHIAKADRDVQSFKHCLEALYSVYNASVSIRVGITPPLRSGPPNATSS